MVLKFLNRKIFSEKRECFWNKIIFNFMKFLLIVLQLSLSKLHRKYETGYYLLEGKILRIKIKNKIPYYCIR